MKPRGGDYWEELTVRYNKISGDTKSVAQVQSNIRKLLDVYKETKFTNSKSGGDPHDCPFDEIMGSKDKVVPRYIGESAIGDDVAEPNIENEVAFPQDLGADPLSDDDRPKKKKESAKKKSRKDEQEEVINNVLGENVNLIKTLIGDNRKFQQSQERLMQALSDKLKF